MTENAYGTDPHKLHRREALDTSVEAAYAVPTTRLEELVHRAIKGCGSHGTIADDVRAMLPSHLPYSSVTARFKALEEKGMILRPPGTKRVGVSGRKQAVMVDADWAAYYGMKPKQEDDVRAKQDEIHQATPLEERMAATQPGQLTWADLKAGRKCSTCRDFTSKPEDTHLYSIKDGHGICVACYRHGVMKPKQFRADAIGCSQHRGWT